MGGSAILADIPALLLAGGDSHDPAEKSRLGHPLAYSRSSLLFEGTEHVNDATCTTAALFCACSQQGMAHACYCFLLGAPGMGLGAWLVGCSLVGLLSTVVAGWEGRHCHPAGIPTFW
jgi:hypothetical protein